jgi:phospholipase C
MNPSKPDPIKHVVLLLLENHSFDQMLGSLKAIYPQLDGVDPKTKTPKTNSDKSGKVFSQCETTERQMLIDPHHELEHVATQLQNNNGGFIRDLEDSYKGAVTDQDKQDIMGYYPLDYLPALHKLGRNFGVCDRWFSSLPGPTWPNRFFALSGTSAGHVEMPDGVNLGSLNAFLEQTQPTIFDRLNEKNITWRVYYHDIPQSLAFTRQRESHNAIRYIPFDRFSKDVVDTANTFPEFTFIEPRYYGADQNDDHPPHDIMNAQDLIAQVYNALRSNGALWESTLLVVLYDEHGGFYDHVVPPPANAPDTNDFGYGFQQLGIRVPALLVSPWVDAGPIQTLFDHTSLLKYLSDKWGLNPMGARVARAETFAPFIGQKLRSDTPPSIALTPDQKKPPEPDRAVHAMQEKNQHQTALIALANSLELHSSSPIIAAERILNILSKHPTIKAWLKLVGAASLPVFPIAIAFTQAQARVSKFLEEKRAEAAKR